MMDLLLRHQALLLLLLLYPFVWGICYMLTTYHEQRTRKRKTREGLETFIGRRGEHNYITAVRHTPLLYILYLTLFVTVLEMALLAEGWPTINILLAKFVAGVLIYPLSHGVVPFDIPGPRITFMIYLWLPLSGQILYWKEHPMSLFVAPLLIIIWTYCWVAPVVEEDKERRRL